MVTEASRRGASRLKAIGLVAAVGLGLLILLSVMLMIAGVKVGSFSLDPTEDTFSVSLRNDTGQAVIVKQCDVKCDSFHEQDRLSAWGTVSMNTSSANSANWWLVTDQSGAKLGCVNLQYDHKQSGAVVNLSQIVDCPK